MRSLFLLVQFLFLGALLHAQDVIVKRDGNEIKCIVKDVGDTKIEFLLYKKQDGPSYEINIDEIEMIIFENGKTSKFAEAEPQKELELGENIYYSSGFWGLNIYQEGYKLSKADANILFEDFPSSLEAYRKGKNKIIIGNVITIPSIVALGYELGSLIITAEANYVVMAIGAVGTLTGVLITVSGNKSIKKAVDGYNTSLDAGVKSTLNFGKTRNGIGLVYSF